VGAPPQDGTPPIGLLREWRGVARLQKAILDATPLKVDELEFEDVLELGLHMLKSSMITGPAVPARVVAAGLRAIAFESGREKQLSEWICTLVPKASGSQLLVGAKSHSDFGEGSELRLRAFAAEMEGRSLRPEEVPGMPGDAFTLSMVEALRRDDIKAGWEGGSRFGDVWYLSARTLLDLGIDIAPRLTGKLSVDALAVELNARKCALARAGGSCSSALNYALANAADGQLVAELIERHEFVFRGSGLQVARDGMGEFERIAFMQAHGVSPLLSRSHGKERERWDAAFALVQYEEGERQSLIRVGEPTSGRAFFVLVRSAAPAERRRLLRSRRQAEGLCELIECIEREPEGVLQWLVKNSDRGLPWPELGVALHGREISGVNLEAGPLSIPETVDKMPIVDLAKAETVVELLGFPECVLDMVVLALLDAGCAARAAVLIAKYPRDSRRNWEKMAVPALLGPGEEALTQFCRRLTCLWEVGSIVSLSAKELTEAGRGGVAVVLESEWRSSRSPQQPGAGEATGTEGCCLAAKLRRCAPHLNLRRDAPAALLYDWFGR
jgi:hypothetical protein